MSEKQPQQITNLIDNVLSKYPRTRDDDKILMLYVWWVQGLKLDKEQQKLFLTKCVTPETITRARRKFNEAGWYRSSEEVQNKRKKTAREMRNQHAAEDSGQKQLEI